MWLPVTITPNGLSNGAPVTGYIIYLDGQKVKDITDPTADSAIIRVPPNSCFEAVTVRTKSKDKLSQVKINKILRIILFKYYKNICTMEADL